MILSFILGLSPGAFAQSPLEQTTQLLNDPGERAKVIAGDAKAKEADDRVKALGLSEAGQNQVYELSSKIMESMTAEAGNDPGKMTDKVNAYLRDPASLENDLTHEQKQKIHDLSESATKK